MCGFFQVIQKKKPVNKDRFTTALRTMNHRGPDAEGVQYDEVTLKSNEKIYLGFGHQRLSILDLDKRSNQPFRIQDSILLYNGEVYNYKRIKENFKKSNIEFYTDGDTEVVFRSLSLNGPRAINEFNGMWSLSMFNKKNATCFFSRDRYGKKPLFYYLDENVFCVSSTIKAIKTYLNINLNFHHDILSNFLLKGSMFPSGSTRTHFENISQILPGHNGFFSCEEWDIKQENYFDWFSKNRDDICSEDELVEALKNSVSLRLTSDRPVGLLLSGGIDSSLLLSILYHYGLHENVKVFMGDTGRSDDYTYAKRCVEQLGIKAETIVSDYGSKTFERFLKVCTHHEKAFPLNGNAIAMPQMYEEIASEGIPVVLDGTGGDEIFGGYWQRHIPFAMNDARREGNKEWMEMMIEANKNKNDIKKYVHSSRFSRILMHKKENFKSNLYNQINPFIKLSTSEIWNCIDSDPLSKLNLATLDYGLTEALGKDIAPGGKLGDWIWHNDRNSMMYSVESRSPFLDVNLHKFMFTDYSQKYHKNYNKFELRKVFNRFTPLPTQYRTEKQGFRWDGKHFFKNNKNEVMELINQSEFLRDIIEVDRFLAMSKRFPNLLKSSLGRRMLSIAGVEYSLKH